MPHCKPENDLQRTSAVRWNVKGVLWQPLGRCHQQFRVRGDEIGDRSDDGTPSFGTAHDGPHAWVVSRVRRCAYDHSRGPTRVLQNAAALAEASADCGQERDGGCIAVQTPSLAYCTVGRIPAVFRRVLDRRTDTTIEMGIV